jgi:hypothetical protein
MRREKEREIKLAFSIRNEEGKFTECAHVTELNCHCGACDRNLAAIFSTCPVTGSTVVSVTELY